MIDIITATVVFPISEPPASESVLLSCSLDSSLLMKLVQKASNNGVIHMSDSCVAIHAGPAADFCRAKPEALEMRVAEHVQDGFLQIELTDAS